MMSSPLKQLELRLNSGRPLYCFVQAVSRPSGALERHQYSTIRGEDWWPFFSAAFAQAHFPKDQGWLLIGSRGVVAELHKDFITPSRGWRQICGRKACYLFCQMI